MSDRLDVIRERIDTETYVFNMRSDLEWLLEQGAALNEANKLLEQTIEVLERSAAVSRPERGRNGLRSGEPKRFHRSAGLRRVPGTTGKMVADP